MTDPIHPGVYIRNHIIPPKMAVKDAAKLLDSGRPALSNLLNGNADLSPEMASRSKKAFNADAEKLLKMQPNLNSIVSVLQLRSCPSGPMCRHF
jgi:addiction module HigA family antidote